MAVASGARSRLIRKFESSYGVSPGGTDWLLCPYYPPLDFGADQTMTDNPLIGLALSRDDGDAIHDAVNHGAALEVPLDKTEFGHWLKMLFGAATTTGSGPDYVHTFKSGGTSIPSAALELGFPDIAQYVLMLGAQANTLEVSATPTGRPTCRVGVLGKSTTRSGSSADSAPTAPSSFEQFLSFSGELTREGSALGRVTSFSFTYSNGLEANRSIGSGEDPEDMTAGAGTLTGSLGVRLADGVLMGDAEDKTPLELALSFTISASKSLTFTLPRVFLPRKRNQVQGKGGVQATFDLRGAYDSSAAAALVVALANQTASYA